MQTSVQQDSLTEAQEGRHWRRFWTKPIQLHPKQDRTAGTLQLQQEN